MKASSLTVNVLLASNRSLILEGLATIIGKEKKYNILAKCSSENEIIENIYRTKPDIIILDMEINKSKLVELLRNILRLSAKIKIIIITGQDSNSNQNIMLNALKGGASAVLSDSIQEKEVLGSILGVYLGEVIISSKIAGEVINAFSPLGNYVDNYQGIKDMVLTPREKEVLSFVAKGNTNKEISNYLFITENTVKVHLSRILSKLHANNRLEAVNIAIEKGLCAWYARTRVVC